MLNLYRGILAYDVRSKLMLGNLAKEHPWPLIARNSKALRPREDHMQSFAQYGVTIQPTPEPCRLLHSHECF